MKMVNLSLSKAELKKRNQPCEAPSVGEAEKYPYGTRINLEKDILDKMPKEVKALDVGETVSITGIAMVIAKSENEQAGGDKRISLELQITELAIVSKDSFDGAFDEKEDA